MPLSRMVVLTSSFSLSMPKASAATRIVTSILADAALEPF